ncbi:hypothetical protein [Lysobacter sp. FW306-1B-D06B]|uniref:hypothetical protein n=1 Tax=Lysobacter sp. FW306-1B-D06B TaxID=3140250 RepID=UPI0031403AF9
MRFVALVLCFVLLSPPAPAADWTSKVLAEGISLDVPGETVPFEDGGMKGFMFKGEHAGQRYALVAVAKHVPPKIRAALTSSDRLAQLYKGIYDGALQQAGGPGGLSTMVVRYAGGLKVLETKGKIKQAHARYRWVYVNGKLCQLTTLTATAASPIADRFFESFRARPAQEQLARP